MLSSILSCFSYLLLLKKTPYSVKFITQKNVKKIIMLQVSFSIFNFYVYTDELYGDFEDLETGQVHRGEEDDENPEHDDDPAAEGETQFTSILRGRSEKCYSEIYQIRVQSVAPEKITIVSRENEVLLCMLVQQCTKHSIMFYASFPNLTAELVYDKN